MRNITKHVELMERAYSNDPGYQAYQEVLNNMSYSEATQLNTQLARYNSLYLNALKQEGLSFSEGDYSFAGYMDFLKRVGGLTKKGIDRHNKASEKLLEAIADPAALSKLAGGASDLVNTLVSKVADPVNDRQYRQMLADADLEKEFGKENVGKVKSARRGAAGWDRDAIAKVALKKMLGFDDESIAKALESHPGHLAKAQRDSLEKRLRDAKGPDEDEDDITRYFDDLPEAEGILGARPGEEENYDDMIAGMADEAVEQGIGVGNLPEAKSGPSDTPEGRMDWLKSLVPDLAKGGYDKKMNPEAGYIGKSPKAAGFGPNRLDTSENMEYNQTPDQIQADLIKKYGADQAAIYQQLTGGKQNLKPDKGAPQPEKPKREAKYGGSVTEEQYKAMSPSQQAALRAKGYFDQKRAKKQDHSENLDMAGSYAEKKDSAKYEKMYKDCMDKAKKEKDPEKKAKLKKKAAECKAKMNYAEAVERGDNKFAFSVINASKEIVKKHEGYSYSEAGMTVSELISKAVDYAFADSSRSATANSGWGDFKEEEGKKEEKKDTTFSSHDKKESYADGEEADNPAALDGGDMMDMVQALSDEEIDQLIMMLEEVKGSRGNEEGGMEAAPAEGGVGEFGEEKEEEYAEDCDKKGKKDHSYSEALKKEDEALEKFYKNCRNSFAEFEYLNQYYNVPLQFSEYAEYDFSEWVDAFKQANSASFNMFGNQCGFNGKLPKQIVVVESDHPEAAYSVYDTEGRFVTLSGIKAFNDLSFNEPFKTAYCTSTQGSRLKSDRVARAALCLK